MGGVVNESDELRARCRHLHGPGPRWNPADVLSAAADWCRANDVTFDVYGQGSLVQTLEKRIAELVGFEAARLMPSGTMAQQIALRVWAERASRPHFGMHPTSHVEIHEQRGYAHLHGLRATLVGPRDRPLLAEHLAAVAEPLAALLIELPIREAGGQLPTWDELQALKDLARTRGIPLHLDGARLWSCGPAYGRPLPEITAGFSSCYVSLYKGLGALSGAVMLGSRSFVDEAMVWQARHGGTLVTQLASAVTTAMQLDERIARMPAWLDHARALAAAIREVPGIRVLPDPPHTELFHVFLPMDPAQALIARDEVAKSHGIWLFGAARPSDVPGILRFELSIQDAALDVRPAEAAEAFAALLRR
jgi:threonine aldolase